MAKNKPRAKQALPVFELDTKDWRVYSPRFSPDSKTLLLAAHKNVGVVSISLGSWKVRTLPELKRSLDQPIQFSPDGSSFVIPIGIDDPMQCWQTNAEKLLWEIAPGSMDAAFSPDGKMLAVTRKKSVVLLEPATGKILYEMSGHKSWVERVAFSPDGSRVASSGETQTALWDTHKGKLIAIVQQKKSEVTAMAFSRDSRFLAVGSGKGVIHIYDSVTGKKHHEWQAHGCNIWRLNFLPDGKTLLSESYVGDDQSIRLWEFPKGWQIYQVPRPRSWKMTPDGKFAVIANGASLELQDLATWQPAGVIELKTPSAISTLEFSPDQRWLMCNLEKGKIQIWPFNEFLKEKI